MNRRLAILTLPVLALTACGEGAPDTAAADAAPAVTVEAKPAPTVTVTATATATATVTVAPPEPSAPASADPADFTFTTVVLSEECFGSAGCNIEWEIDTIDYTGDGEFVGPARILYDVTGLDDPMRGYVEVDAAGEFSYSTERGGTESAGAVPEITVTEVRMQ